MFKNMSLNISKQFLHAPSRQDTNEGPEARPLAGVAPSAAPRPRRPGPGLSPRTVRATQAPLSCSPRDHRQTQQRDGRYWQAFQRWRPSYCAAVPNGMHSCTKCVKKTAKHSARFRLIKHHFYTARKTLYIFVVSTSPQQSAQIIIIIKKNKNSHIQLFWVSFPEES